MSMIRMIFWFAMALVMAAFSLRNWTPVTLNLWGDLVMDTWLPLPVLLAFLLGLLPYFILHRATRWTLRRKLDIAQRQIAELRAILSPVPTDDTPAGTIPPSAAPIAVPPGVS